MLRTLSFPRFVIAAVVGVSLAGCASNEPGTALRVDTYKFSTVDLEAELAGWTSAYAAADSASAVSVAGAATTKATPTTSPARFRSDLVVEILQAKLFGRVFSDEIAARKVDLTKVDAAQVQQTLLAIVPGAQAYSQTAGPDAVAKVLAAAPPKLITELTEAARTQVGLDLAVETLVKTPKATYDANPEQFGETCVKHILVASEQAAAALRKELVGGRDFAEAAKKLSTDTGSGANGGELGCGSTAQYVPEFGAAAEALAVDAISEPIQTQFGWHLLVVTKRTAVPFDKVDAAQLQAQARTAAAKELTTSLLKRLREYDVEVNPKFGTLIPAATDQEPVRIGPPSGIGPSPTTALQVG